MIAALLWGCGPRPAAPSRGAEPASFLTARLRGAIDADLAWNAPGLSSEGGARPDGSGIRVSLAGSLVGGQRVRLVFGLAAAPGQASARAVPTNLTLIIEGANRVYATLGDDKCSVDALEQRPIAATAGVPPAPPLRPGGDYWVSARGFCVEPAATLDGAERVLLSRFDFRGRIHLEAADLHVPAQRT
ncbi:MAG: hypothetical protein U1F30_00045 [Steroidobacteraceae bacterium]